MSSCCSHDNGLRPSMPRCRDAEQRLLQLLPPSASVSFKDTKVELPPSGRAAVLHSVEVAVDDSAAASTEPPLVMLPGYGTGAAIFTLLWACLFGSERAEHQALRRRRMIAVDPLGWFLSSHPSWTCGLRPELSDTWFVDSLEAWRAARGFERLDLLGHSIGGNIAATYAEHHPQHLRRLVLLSPAGTPREPEDYRGKLPMAPWRMRLLLRLWGRGWTPHDGLKFLPSRWGYRIAHWNARRWSRSDTVGQPNLDEMALADYIYYGWTEGNSSGERVLGAMLHPGAWGKRPLCDRVPALRLPRVELIYGDRDWMDARHGNEMAERCMPLEEQRQASGVSEHPAALREAGVGEAQRAHATEGGGGKEPPPPELWVQIVRGAGHYAHLENVPALCDALAQALGDKPRPAGTRRTAELPPGFSDRFSGPNVPAWRSWEGYAFGR